MNSITMPGSEHRRPHYHFTTFENFKSICKDGKPILTRCSNAKNNAVETMALDSYIRGLGEDQITHLIKEFCVDSLKSLLSKILFFRDHTYITCFSSFNDEKELVSENAEYLWKYYADAGKGVAIQYEFTSYNTNTTSLHDGRRESEARFVKMEYITDPHRLMKFKMGIAGSPLWADEIKPTFCSIEMESRFLVYLNSINEEEINNVNTRLSIGQIEALDSDRLLYKFPQGSMKKVFCKDEETYTEIGRIINGTAPDNQVEVIRL